MKLSQWAKNKGISYLTAYRMVKSGKLPEAEILPTGTIIINNTEIVKNYNICIYARVSSNDRKKELNYQVNRLIEFAGSKGLSIDKIYKEVASGMNDNRKEFWKMMDSNPSTIIIENKDRLTRFGFNYIEKLCKKLNIEIVVMNKDFEDEKDLIKDLVSIITSFCCRLYGLRRGYNKAKKINGEITNDNLKEAT
jgi:putative resolvase